MIPALYPVSLSGACPRLRRRSQGGRFIHQTDFPLSANSTQPICFARARCQCSSKESYPNDLCFNWYHSNQTNFYNGDGECGTQTRGPSNISALPWKDHESGASVRRTTTKTTKTTGAEAKTTGAEAETTAAGEKEWDSRLTIENVDERDFCPWFKRFNCP